MEKSRNEKNVGTPDNKEIFLKSHGTMEHF
jgi:hypothetical protein